MSAKCRPNAALPLGYDGLITARRDMDFNQDPFARLVLFEECAQPDSVLGVLRAAEKLRTHFEQDPVFKTDLNQDDRNAIYSRIQSRVYTLAGGALEHQILRFSDPDFIAKGALTYNNAIQSFIKFLQKDYLSDYFTNDYLYDLRMRTLKARNAHLSTALESTITNIHRSKNVVGAVAKQQVIQQSFAVFREIDYGATITNQLKEKYQGVLDSLQKDAHYEWVLSEVRGVELGSSYPAQADLRSGEWLWNLLASYNQSGRDDGEQYKEKIFEAVGKAKDFYAKPLIEEFSRKAVTFPHIRDLSSAFTDVVKDMNGYMDRHPEEHDPFKAKVVRAARHMGLKALLTLRDPALELKTSGARLLTLQQDVIAAFDLARAIGNPRTEADLKRMNGVFVSKGLTPYEIN